MPLYEYECAKCHTRTEKIESVSGPHLKKCPNCGGRVERVVTAPAIQFKGAGWYVTDYAGKNASRAEGAASENSAASDPSKESKKETATKESKEKKSSKAK